MIPPLTRRIDTPEYRRDYTRGWKASARAGNNTLDNADSRGEPDAWYDGYFDYAAGREKWTRLLHPELIEC